MAARIRKSWILVPSALLSLFVLTVFFFFDKDRWSKKSLLCTGFGLLLPVLAVILILVNPTRRFLNKAKKKKYVLVDFVVGVWTITVCVEADGAGPSKELVFAIANTYIVWGFFMETETQLRNELGLMVTTTAIAFQKGLELGKDHHMPLWLIPLAIYLVLCAAIFVFNLKPEEETVKSYMNSIGTLLKYKVELVDHFEQVQNMRYNERRVIERLIVDVGVELQNSKKEINELRKMQHKIVNQALSTEVAAKVANKKVADFKVKCVTLKRRLAKVKVAKIYAIPEVCPCQVALEKKIENLKTIIKDNKAVLVVLPNKILLVQANNQVSGAMSLTDEDLRLSDLEIKAWYVYPLMERV